MEEKQVKKAKIKYAYGIVKCKLNLRDKANSNSDILDVLSRGLKIKINLTASTDKFYSTTYRSVDGYVAKDFVELCTSNTKKEEDK